MGNSNNQDITSNVLGLPSFITELKVHSDVEDATNCETCIMRRLKDGIF